MQCSNCGTKVILGDRFCEECGMPIAASSPAKVMGGCAKCGAAATAIDAEGYCSECGFRQENRLGDRFENIVDSNLAGISDRGVRRNKNEDWVACAKLDNRNAYILVVCDGVSSSDSSELAATVAAETVCRTLLESLSGLDSLVEKDRNSFPQAIKSAIAEAKVSVCAIPESQNSGSDPSSTTIVAAIVCDRSVTIAWLGDSRAYWISSSPNIPSQQLTRDNSWLYEAIASGEISETEARRSPHAHAITRWLGSDMEDWEPAIANFEFPNSGYLLLCTDGLWNYATEVLQMEAIVNSKADKEAAIVARRLVDFAKSRGGHDNITVAILSVF